MNLGAVVMESLVNVAMDNGIDSLVLLFLQELTIVSSSRPCTPSA